MQPGIFEVNHQILLDFRGKWSMISIQNMMFSIQNMTFSIQNVTSRFKILIYETFAAEHMFGALPRLRTCLKRWDFKILGHLVFKMWRPIFKMWLNKNGKKISKSLLQIFSLTDELSESFGITKFVRPGFEKSELKQHHRMNIDSICDAGGFNLWRVGSEKNSASESYENST